MRTNRSCFRSCGQRQLVRVRRVQPLIAVLGVLTGAGAAKSGQGALVAGGILSATVLYFGALVTAAATRSLATLVTRLQRCDPARC
jgi:hypothetical protein